MSKCKKWLINKKCSKTETKKWIMLKNQQNQKL